MFPLGNAAPEELYVQVSLHIARAQRSALLAPVLPLQRKPFANITSLIRLIAEAKGAEPKSDRSLTSCPSLNLKCWLATTAPRESQHPFRADLEPLYDPLQVVIRFLCVLMPASPIASLAGYLPLPRFIGARAENRGYHVPSPAGPSVPGPVRLAPAYSPTALWRCAPSRREATGHPPLG